MSDLEQMREAAALALTNVASHFKPSARLTLIVRLPGNDEADFVLTDDDLKEAALALDRRRRAQAFAIADAIYDAAGESETKE